MASGHRVRVAELQKGTLRTARPSLLARRLAFFIIIIGPAPERRSTMGVDRYAHMRGASSMRRCVLPVPSLSAALPACMLQVAGSGIRGFRDGPSTANPRLALATASTLKYATGELWLTL